MRATRRRSSSGAPSRTGSSPPRSAACLPAARSTSPAAKDGTRCGSPKAAELAASRGVDVEWVVADVLDHTPEPRAFDLAALLYLQLPRDDLLRAVRSAARAVAPGGTLVVLGHDTTNLSHGHGGPKDASVLYTAEDVVTALGDLVVERAEAVERSVPLEHGEAVAIDAFVRAHRPD